MKFNFWPNFRSINDRTISISNRKKTRSLPQIAMEVKFNTNFYRMPLNRSIDLSDGSYVMGVISFNTYNSIFNITEKNNLLYYNDTINNYIITLPYDAYELSQINEEVFRQISNVHNISNILESPIKISANESTLHSVIDWDINYSIDFRKENTLRNILGFDSKVLYSGYNYSDKKVNIIDVDRIHLCCDSIIGSIRNGHPSNILFTKILNEPPGAKIVREPNLVLYKHIDKEKIDFLEFWFEDSFGNRIDNHGENINFTLHIKKNSWYINDTWSKEKQKY